MVYGHYTNHNVYDNEPLTILTNNQQYQRNAPYNSRSKYNREKKE